MKRVLFIGVFLLGLSIIGIAGANTTNSSTAKKAGKTEKAEKKVPLSFELIGLDKGDAKDNVVKVLENKRKLLRLPVTREAIYHFQQDMPEAIHNALRPFGYYQAGVTKIKVHHANKQWTMTVKINPGSQIKIAVLDLKITGAGAHDRNFKKLLKHFPLKQGGVLNTQQYGVAKDELFSLASKRGYFNAKMTACRIIVDLDRYKAKVVIHFDTGQRFRFGKTHFSQSGLDDSLLYRYLPYEKGDYYNEKKVEQLQQDLSASGYFKTVLVQSDVDNEKNGYVPIHIKLTPRKTQDYLFGLGYGTDTGVRATIGMKFRRLNRYGHRLNLLLRGSIDDSSGAINYIIPGHDPANSRYTFSAVIGHLDIDPGDSTYYRGSVAYTMKLTKRLRQVISINYLHEKSRVKALSASHIKADTVFVNAQWQYLSHRRTVTPKHSLSVTLQLIGSPYLSVKHKKDNEMFWQARITAKALTTLEWTHTRFLLRGSLGHTSIDDLADLPLSLQLFTGGSRTVRGYTFQSIGPGKNLVVGSAEIQQRVYGDWYVGMFYDIGNVSSSNLFSNMKRSWGPALVWLSPIGEVEVSVAKAIDRDDQPWVFQFGIGTSL